MPAAIPLIVAGVSAASTAYSAHKANQRQKNDKKAYEDRMNPDSYAEGDPLRDFLNGRTYDTNTTGSSNSSTSGTYGSNTYERSNPFLTGEYKGLGDLMRNTITSRLNNNSLPKGYEQGGIRAINRTNAAVNTSLQDKLTSSGLLGGPAEAQLLSNAENSRGASIADFQSNLPLVQRQMQTEDLNLASMLTNLFGKGTESRSRTNGWQNSNTFGTSSSTQSGGVPPGLLARMGQQYVPTPVGTAEQLFSNMPQLLMFLQGSGLLGGNKSGQDKGYGVYGA